MVTKHLVTTEAEYVELFAEYTLEEAEDFLGVEFANEDGTFPTDDEDSDQEASKTIYRKLEGSQFPESYPCLVLLANDNDFDRTGALSFKLVFFVYPEDFNQ